MAEEDRPDETKPVSMTGILSDLDQVAIPPTTPEEKKRAELNALSDAEKMRKAQEFRYQGIPVESLSRIFDVSVRTVYRWLADVKRQFREQFEGETAADLLSENLQWLQRIENTCLYEATQLGKDGKEFDPTTGKVIDTRNQHQSKGVKVKFLNTALKARQMGMNMQMETGLIPRERDRLFRTLAEDAKVTDSDKSDGRKTRSREELLADILDKLQRTQILE